MAEIGTDITRAVELLKEGKLVAIPTETVYGLAANALNTEAVAAIFHAKNRPHFDPLICHIGNSRQMTSYATQIATQAFQIANDHWPGPVTLLLDKKPVVPDLVTSGLERVALRVPDHPLTREVLQNVDFPLAAPSANPFGYVSPTLPVHVNEQLGDQVAYILDGGPCRVGIESTILSFDDEGTHVHRLGGLKPEALEPYGPLHYELNQNDDPSAPGQLSAHYSPGKKLVIGVVQDLIDRESEKGIATITFRDEPNGADLAFVLSPAGDLDEAATQLFAALRACDTPEIRIVFIEKFPDYGLGRAINDRLKRAAATNQS